MDGKNAGNVKSTLESMGVDPETLDARTKSQLLRLEDAIREELAAAGAAREELRRHELTVSNLAKRSGISRATFYNKRILADYLRARRPHGELEALKKELEAALERAERAEDTVAKLMKRDGEIVAMRSEMKHLRRRIALLEAQPR